MISFEFTLHRSVLEYCCPVWHSSLFVQLSERIERVPTRALRIIFPAFHYEDALKLSGCTTLCERRDLLCAKTFEKIKEPGSRIHQLMAPTRARTHGCSLRFNDRPSLTNVKQSALRKVSSLTCALKLMVSGGIFSNIITCSKVL